MPKKAKELSARAVAHLKEDGRYAVGGADGLHLRIHNGNKSWVLRIVVGNKRRDFGLGTYPAVPLAQAREQAREMRKAILAGQEPPAPRRQAKQQLIALQQTRKTFAECADALIASKSNEWKNAKHCQQWRNTLATYAFPVLGDMPVEQIELPHILACLEPIWTAKTETASRLRGRIEAVLDYATVRQYRSGSNPARWKGHLDSILPKPSKVQKTEHHPAMPIDQVPAFMATLHGKQGISVRALEFLILTAARSGEVRGATWDEINLQERIWTIPAGRMKAGIEHRVPLSQQAQDLLRALPRMADSAHIFPSPRGKALSDMALTAVMRKLQCKEVPHGFRSSFRDWAGERTNYPREVAEQALAHTLSNKAEAAYRRGDALEKRRAMMQDWADFCKPVK